MGMRILVTGGCGFIGSNFVRHILEHYKPTMITNIDALTYAGNEENLAGVQEEYGERYDFFRVDIADAAQVEKVMEKHAFFAIVNFAAESHVDRSINSPENFIHTNVVGTNVLLEAARRHGVKRFVQISTDEVYGTLGEEGVFLETSPLAPSSPYSASKASADLLAQAYHRTYGMETMITRCTNNYGRYQYPEKLIPLMVVKSLRGEKLPVYGDGLNVRDWIHVEDHCTAIMAVLLEGKAGQVYNVGVNGEMRNLDLVKMILKHLGKSEDLIEFVEDRLGHDWRYAVDASLLRNELNWKPLHRPEQGILETVDWYVENEGWWTRLLSLHEEGNA